MRERWYKLYKYTERMRKGDAKLTKVTSRSRFRSDVSAYSRGCEIMSSVNTRLYRRI